MIKPLSKFSIFLAFLLFSINAFASIDVYPFKNPAYEHRFNHLTQVLRCPKCQNNNLADSNAELAKALKDIIYEKIQTGQSDAEIVAYLKQRYGDFISYNPPFNYKTLIIWIGPFLLLGLGLFGLINYARKRQPGDKTEMQPVENEVKSKLQQWANESDEKSSLIEDEEKQ